MVYGGRKSDSVFNDFWVFNIETNHWFNWTTILSSGPIYPSGRYKGILTRTIEGFVLYSGTYMTPSNYTATDSTTAEYLTYVTDCQEVLTNYSVSIYDIGTTAFAAKQASLYALTKNACFLQSTPMPSFSGDIKFLQEVWFFNLTQCDHDCFGNGYCDFGTCYCGLGYYGNLCENVMCPGSFCIYDNEFFSTASCIHCSGYGECNEGVCNCTEGYSGSDCSMQSCVNNCTGNGDCMEFYPVSQCECYFTYGGDTCQVDFCLNMCNPPHGSCNLTNGLCTCEAGYYGIDCSVIGFSGASWLEISIVLLLIFLN